MSNNQDWLSDFKSRGSIPNFDPQKQPVLDNYYKYFPQNTGHANSRKVTFIVGGSMVAAGFVMWFGNWVNSKYSKGNPISSTPEWKEASQKRRQNYNMDAVNNHKVGDPIVLPKAVVSDTVVVGVGKTRKRSDSE